MDDDHEAYYKATSDFNELDVSSIGFNDTAAFYETATDDTIFHTVCNPSPPSPCQQQAAQNNNNHNDNNTAATTNNKENRPVVDDNGENAEEEISVPKGSYNIDFDNLDAFDPFQTKSKINTAFDTSIDTASDVPFQTKAKVVTAFDPSTEPALETTSEAITSDLKQLELSNSDANEEKTHSEKTPPKNKTNNVSKSWTPPIEGIVIDANEEEGAHVPKGAYSIDFDNLNSLDPFQTKSKVNTAFDASTSPDVSAEIPVPKGAYSIDFDNLDSLDPFQTKSKVVTAFDTSTEPTLGDATSENTKEIPNEEESVKHGDSEKSVPKKTPVKPWLANKTKKKAWAPHVDDDIKDAEEEIPAPKGAYSIDFDNLDSLDPFQTKSKVNNTAFDSTVNVSSELSTSTSALPSSTEDNSRVDLNQEKVPVENDSATSKKAPVKPWLADKKKRKSKHSMPPPEDAEIVVEEEIPLPKGAYNIDFDNLDAFDPFQTKSNVKTTFDPSDDAVSNNDGGTKTEDSNQSKEPGSDGSNADVSSTKESPVKPWLAHKKLPKALEPKDDVENPEEEIPVPKEATLEQFTTVFGSPIEASTPTEATFAASSKPSLLSKKTPDVGGRGGFGFGGKGKMPLTPSGLLYGRSRQGALGGSPVQNDHDCSTISDVSAASSLHVDAGASAEAMKITDDEFEREEKAKEIREIKRLLQLKKEKAAMLAQKRFYIDSLEQTVTDLERRAEELELELASANERYTSLEKTYLYKRLLFEEKCAKIQDLRKTLKRKARKDEQMKRAVEAKEKEFQLFMKDYIQRKNAATSAIDSINKQLESAREAARRSTMVLETKVRHEQLKIDSMKKKMEMKKQEKADLLKMCEDLFAHKQEASS